jgi:hypothetical protein
MSNNPDWALFYEKLIISFQIYKSPYLMDQYQALIQILVANWPWNWPTFKALRATNRAFLANIRQNMAKILPTLFVDDYVDQNVSLLKLASRHNIQLGLNIDQLKYINWPMVYIGAINGQWRPNIDLNGPIAALEAKWPINDWRYGKYDNDGPYHLYRFYSEAFNVYSPPFDQLLGNIKKLIAHHFQSRSDEEINKLFQAFHYIIDNDMADIIKQLRYCWPFEVIEAFEYDLYLKHRHDRPKLAKMFNMVYSAKSDDPIGEIDSLCQAIHMEMFDFGQEEINNRGYQKIFELENISVDGPLAECLLNSIYQQEVVDYLVKHGLNNILKAYLAKYSQYDGRYDINDTILAQLDD